MAEETINNINSDIFSRLPEDINRDIFSRVPVRSLLACKCLNKKWNAFTSDSSFIECHLKHTIEKDEYSLMLRLSNYDDDDDQEDDTSLYSVANGSLPSTSWVKDFASHAVRMDYPFRSIGCSIDLIGSCNGILCIWINQKLGFFCLWNPATKEYAEIPRIDHVSGKSNIGVHYAFGHDKTVDDYKLVRLVTKKKNASLVQVYSLLLKSWKIDQTIPYTFHNYYQPGLLVNGAFHWLGEGQGGAAVIVSLDISTESFHEIELPEEHLKIISLGVLDGCLCALVDYPEVSVDVWVLQNYGVRGSWTRRLIMRKCLSHYSQLRLMWCFASAELLFDYTSFATLYDSRSDNSELLKLRVENNRNYELKYFETLVSLDSRTYVGSEDGEEDSSEDDEEDLSEDGEEDSTEDYAPDFLQILKQMQQKIKPAERKSGSSAGAGKSCAASPEEAEALT